MDYLVKTYAGFLIMIWIFLLISAFSYTLIFPSPPFFFPQSFFILSCHSYTSRCLIMEEGWYVWNWGSFSRPIARVVVVCQPPDNVWTQTNGRVSRRCVCSAWEMHGFAGACLQVHGFSACGARVGGAYVRWEELLTCLHVNFSGPNYFLELTHGFLGWISSKDGTPGFLVG